MKKYITKKELKGIQFNPDITYLLEDINRKGDIFGRYFSSWWFDFHHSKEEEAAMDSIIWALVVNNVSKFGYYFNDGQEAQLDLRAIAEFIGEKLNNVWYQTIIKWFRGMAYSGYKIDVCDACGLNSLYIKLS